MEKKLRLCVVTQDATLFDSDVDYVNLPTTNGSIGILTGHCPMVCSVGRGVIRCAFAGEGGAMIDIAGGIAEVSNNTVTVLATEARVR